MSPPLDSVCETAAQERSDPISPWMGAIREALGSISSVLGSDELSIEREGVFPSDFAGNYVHLYGEQHTIRIGISGEMKVLSAMVNAMFGADPDDPVPVEDVCDGIGEIADIFVGNIKTMMGGRFPDLTVGLPMMMYSSRFMSRTPARAFRTRFKTGSSNRSLQPRMWGKGPVRGRP